ncbi:MAG: metal ABC transporter ATP-binding protein [Euryarchaeota archaeon]|jgi:zinc transport system ATP-binding protein|nr:metal ABC transporter ATP-binding protein [Euryarchaeota archaeon]MBT5735224.1 metal ABC transporter ATP-binding protein [Euryarchaeota archaeon]
MTWNQVKNSEDSESILVVDNLSVSRSGRMIISDINLKVSRGEFIGLVGPNGSGKSTLILSILGILKPHTGLIKIYDEKPMSKNIFGKLGWVSQAAANLPSNIKITVRELVKLGTLKSSSMYKKVSNQKEKIDTAMTMVGIECCADCDVSTLSGGQRQRAVIARALASEAEFILLDEPLVGIDRESRNSLLKLLDKLCHEQQKTILMVSHDITAIRQTAHRMVYLEETIRYDGPTENFPDLTSLAGLRGITPVHDDKHTIEPHDHNKCMEEE